MRSRSNSGVMLDVYHEQVTKLVLRSQDPVTGLLSPRDGSVYHDHAWVRDNVYCIMSVWGLSLAYKKCTTDKDSEARVNYLEKAVVKLMRGLMQCMLSQCDKIEDFKRTQNKYDAIHAKFDARSALPCVSDYEWGHLQMDAIALYVLMVAQMTVSGLQIVFNHDEVCFMQNLVYYLEQSYRTPDFGVWERGDKTNRGQVELNASSIGMAKAALQAIHGVDLFGARGSSQSVITCQPDEITQCNAVLESLLPRESNSKETDLALMTILTYPAFAVEREDLITETRESVCHKLRGDYGCARFLRDGYRTAVEDPNRLYYESHELKQFEGIECEWPLGFCFLLLDALFREDKDSIEFYRKKLDTLLVPCPELGFHVLPELYFVPSEGISKEKAHPGSCERLPGGKAPHTWSHSLWILCSLICDGLITIGEIDPLNRRLSFDERPDVIVQIAPICENAEIQASLKKHGFLVETAADLKKSINLRLFHANVLSKLFAKLGESQKLQLTGRVPHEYIGIEATSKFYVVKDNLLAFVPFFYNKQKFYLALDNKLMLNSLRIMVQYLKLYWRSLGRPTMILYITKNFFHTDGRLHEVYLNTLNKCKSGMLDGLRVSFGSVQSFRSTSSVRRLGFLERIIDEFQTNPLDDHEAVALSAYMPENSVLSQKRPSERVSFTEQTKRKMSVFRAISTTRGISLPPEHKNSKESDVTTSFLKPMSSSQQLQTFNVTREEIEKTNEDDLVDLLRATESIQEQLDVLVFFYNKHGLGKRVALLEDCEIDEQPTVEVLLEELYHKASDILAWSILRYSASLLRKIKDNLAPAVVEILVRQKTLTVGMPPEPREKSISRPIPPEDILDLIYDSCGPASPLAAFSQEIIVGISLLVRTQQELFDGILRIRVGLIIQVLSQEIARSLNVDFDQGMDQLLRLEPYCVHELVCHLFAGKEIRISLSNRKPGEGQTNLVLVNFSKKDMSRIKMNISDVEAQDAGLSLDSREDSNEMFARGTWLRRRRVDGSLNRVPIGFYNLVWKLLDRCQEGISVEGNMLYAGWTQEMTIDELKFALRVEAVFSKLSQPEYRQVLIEALMVLASTVEFHYQTNLHAVVKVEDLARHANSLFLKDLQTNNPGTKTEELSNGIRDISYYFYDSAPSGRYGSLTYLTMATVMYLEAVSPLHQDKITCKVT